MPDVVLTAQARDDLLSIGRYTQKTWGVRQRVRYLTILDQTIQDLGTTRRLDRNRDDIRPGLLSCLCRAHMIYFRRHPDGRVVVLRILGKSMDVNRHL